MSESEALQGAEGVPALKGSVARPPLRDRRHGTLMSLCEQAVLATDVAFTITDPNVDDNPWIWVNPAFTSATGYAFDEVVGQNCRMLQGTATDEDSIATLTDAIAARRKVTVTFLSYRKDGTTFWNQLSMSPVFDAQGGLASYVGVHTDVSERVLAETERQRALEAERTARHDAAAAHQRFALLAEVTTQLASTLNVDEILERLADLIVPALADAVVIEVFDERGGAERSASHHRAGHAGMLALLQTASRQLAIGVGTEQFLQHAQPLLVPEVATFDWPSLSTSTRLSQTIDALGAGSVIFVPVIAYGRRFLASMLLFRGPPARPYRHDDLALAEDVGRRAGLTLDNARLYEHDHRVAVTLQNSLLPDLGIIQDVSIAARYLTGDARAHVGGDFFEVLPLPDGSIGVAVGDVLGHDLTAAAAMGHLRGLLRACAWNSVQDGRHDPRDVLDRVDQLVQALEVVPLATLFYGRLERPLRQDGPWQFTYANAGHPPPMARRADGTVEVLDDAPGVLLGVAAHSERQSAIRHLASGTILLAYTDGLVERRGEDLSQGIERVGNVLRQMVTSPEQLADALLMTAEIDRCDDIAILLLQLLAPCSDVVEASHSRPSSSPVMATTGPDGLYLPSTGPSSGGFQRVTKSGPPRCTLPG